MADDDPTLTDLETTPKKTATDIYYPDGNGDVEVGLPPEPSARPVSDKVGIPFGASPSDLPEAGRKTLGQWLNKGTEKNITPVPGEEPGTATPTIDTSQHPFKDPAEVKTVYGEDPNTGIPALSEAEISAGYRSGLQYQLPYGKDGNANTLLRDAYSGEDNAFGPYQDPTTPGVGGDVDVPSVILSRNRFEPGFDSWAGKNEDRDTMTAWSNTQKLKGTSKGYPDGDPSMADSFGKYSAELDGIAMEELANVAEQLLLNAVGDFKSGFGDKDAATGNIGAGDAVFTTQLGRGRNSTNADEDFRPSQAIKPAYGKGRTSGEWINGAMNSKQNPATVVEDLKSNKGYKRRTFGVLNNHLEPFAPALPVSMIFLAIIAALTSIIAVIVLGFIVDVLGLAIGLISGAPGSSFKPYPAFQDQDPSKMAMGHAFGKSDFSSMSFFGAMYKWFGLPPLEGDYDNNFPFTTAAIIGGLEFFIGHALQSPFQFPQIASNSAGYYVIVVRNAMRDMDQISDAASGMGGGGVTGFIEGFFGLIDAFVSSATWRFAITLIQIGDRIFCGPGLTGKRDSDGRITPEVLPEHTPYGKTIADLGGMVRIRSTSPRLSYSFSSLPQVYIRPAEAWKGNSMSPTGYFSGGGDAYTSMGDAFGDFRDIAPGDARPAGLSTFVGNIQPTDLLMGQSMQVTQDPGQSFLNRLSYVEGGRLPTAFRQSVEDELDAYYVPFYFHDLRTNEILPLPVFVSNITDSFNPEYSEVKGFGRMDPVQIYGGTTRKIGFAFYMVATNEEDYSALYYGINKLVSMVYPQWSPGTPISNANDETFETPYSKVMTSSPLIRLRLGELFASNRSPETVRRLFGAHKSSFRLGMGEGGEYVKPDHFTDPVPMGVNMYPAVLQAGKNESLQPSTYGLIYASNIIAVNGDITTNALPGLNFAGCSSETGTGGALTMQGNSCLLPEGVLVTIDPKKRYPSGEWTGMKWKKCRGRYGKKKGAGTVAKIINYAAFPLGEKSYPDHKGGGLKNQLYYVVVPPDEIPTVDGKDPGGSPIEWDVSGVSGKKSPVGVLVPINEVDLFIPIKDVPRDPPLPFPPLPGTPEPEPPPVPITDGPFFQRNVIVKAMEDAGGRGIAGVIRSLDFDWNEAPWNTSAALGRAPKFVKVTMTFAPIHDEPLGLNADGSLRAPAYPVGSYVENVFGARFGLPGRPPPREAMSLLAQAQEKAKAAQEAAAEEDNGANPEEEPSVDA